MKTKLCLSLGLMALLVCNLSPLVRAGTVWTGGAGNGDWNTAGNWSAGVPAAGVTAIFNSTSPAGTVTLSANGIAARIRQNSSAPARTITISPSATSSLTLSLDGTAAELFDLVAATANLTLDGTPNVNGAKLTLDIAGDKPTPVNTGITLGLNLDISGTGSINLTGPGTITLGGINTYSGNTRVINGGTISLPDDARLTFYIGANGVNNQITYITSTGGTVLLNGDFAFDLTNADLTNGNSWNIVDVANLNETFGSTFSVIGFTENNNVWTMSSGVYQWTFTEATGLLELTVIPEPSVAALALIGALGLWMFRWRKVL